MPDFTESQIKKFWSKVKKSDEKACWEWQGATKPTGYGNIRINKKYSLAHRVAWEIKNFPIPSGYIVMHICDNPKCCNPSHLVIGTKKSNTFDMIKKGRDGYRKNRASGERNGNSKLSAVEVLEIRGLYPSSSQEKIAEKYNVKQTTIGRIVNNETWRNI